MATEKKTAPKVCGHENTHYEGPGKLLCTRPKGHGDELEIEYYEPPEGAEWTPPEYEPENHLHFAAADTEGNPVDNGYWTDAISNPEVKEPEIINYQIPFSLG